MKLTSFLFSSLMSVASLFAAESLDNNPFPQSSSHRISTPKFLLCGSTTSGNNPYEEATKNIRSPFFRAKTIEEFVIRGDYFYEHGYIKEAFENWNYASRQSSLDGLLRVATVHLSGCPELGISRNPGYGYQLICDLSNKGHFPSMYQRAMIEFEGYYGIPINTFFALNTMQFLSAQGYTPATEFLNNKNT